MTTLLFTRFSRGGTTLNFEVPLICDLIDEGIETFDLTATILDNDAPPDGIPEGNFTVGGDQSVGTIIDCPNRKIL